MKIVHLCLGAFYPDNYSYQENMLPKFHKSLGHEVEVIASQESFDKDGNTCYVSKVGYYQNEYDIKVCRLQYSWPEKVNHKLKHYKGVYEALSASTPDIIFIHNCQFTSIFAVIKYIKQNPKLIVYVDNHVDFSNSARNWVSKNILHKILWKKCAQSINPFVKKFYGVLPARVDFLVNIYGLPKEKVELLVMGVDDEQVERAIAEKTRAEIRKKYNIAEDDFLVMTGGKIDRFKKQTLLLMEAIKKIDNPKVKLLVFGSVTPDLKEQVNALCDGDKVQYIGWIQSVKSYDYFSAADIAVFPGRHSVFWEQVAGMGIPMICKYWDGTTHVERDGNVRFLYKDSTDEIYQVINTLANNTEQFDNMKKAAEKDKTYFSYKDIAKRAIES
jgi:1,2-diacylglycerol 3-alpha-glucosyltransferase